MAALSEMPLVLVKYIKLLAWIPRCLRQCPSSLGQRLWGILFAPLPSLCIMVQTHHCGKISTHLPRCSLSVCVPDPAQGAREPFRVGHSEERGLQLKGIWCQGVIRVTGK